MKHVKVQWNIVLFSYYVFLLMQEFDHLTFFKKLLIVMKVNLVSGNSDSLSVKEQNHVQLLAQDDYLALNSVFNWQKQ